MSEIKLGGRLRFFKPYWKMFCTDRYVMRLLSGIKIPFKNGKIPHQVREQPELSMTDAERRFVDNHLLELLQEGCIKKLEVPLPHGWVSNIFLVPKPNGRFRMILNLKKLNEYVVYTKFQLNQIQKVLDMVLPHDYLCSLDLVSAFSHLYVDKRYHRFFQFKWKGEYYCFCTMPQGFTDSPRLFVRLTSPVMALLHRHMVDILIYKDDTFLRAASSELLERNIKLTRDVLTKCGFVINEEKSCLQPAKEMEFLGFLINTATYTVTVSNKKRKNLKSLLNRVLPHPKHKITIHFLAKIIGKIVSFFPASDEAKLHYRTLEKFKTKCLLVNSSWSAKIRLSEKCLQRITMVG